MRASERDDDQGEIDGLTTAFFNLFALDEGGRVDLDAIHDLFIPEGVIVKACTGAMEVYDLSSFAAPRVQLLNSGEFTSFHEQEVSGKTDIFQNVAQRFSRYRKWGERAGVAFESHGTKSIQFVKTPGGWKISALVWDDDP